MAGGLMQLIAYGAQDIYLTGNPQITFFKVVYRRHTNFSIEAVVQAFNGDIKSATSATATCTISRSGDLISNMWLDVKMQGQGTIDAAGSYCNWINNTGHAFIDNCEIEIGGQLIDKQYGMWLDIWNELTDRDDTEWQGLNKHERTLAYIDKNAALDSEPTATTKRQGADQVLQLYIPLKFWFCRNPGLALPMIALQYHEVKFKLTTRGMAGLIAHVGSSGLTAAAPTTCDLWVDYIYLDTDEKRRFAQVSHEYLIEQVQRNTGDSAVNNTLNFDHPVKEIIWVCQHSDVGAEKTNANINTANDVRDNIQKNSSFKPNDYFNYSAGATNTSEYLYNNPGKEWFTTGQLQLNGEDRFALRNATYFRTCQPAQSGHLVPGKRIYCYSFALRPEEHQPSGTCNL
jgi:hypothetical protein